MARLLVLLLLLLLLMGPALAAPACCSSSPRRRPAPGSRNVEPGEDGIARVLALARTRPLDAALLEVTGHDAAELEADWRRWYDLKPLSPPG